MSMDTEHKADARDVLDLGAAPSMTEDKPAEAGATVSVPEVEADAKQELDIPQEEIERITRDVIEALKTVFDPEIPVDIYELGLIYQVDLEPDHVLKVEMTLTARAVRWRARCPAGSGTLVRPSRAWTAPMSR